MTTTALKAIDAYGGIDNYILRLDDNAVSQSNYVTKMRLLISSALFHKGELDKQVIRRMGYDKIPPSIVSNNEKERGGQDEALSPHLV
jgi:hypothetical protein